MTKEAREPFEINAELPIDVNREVPLNDTLDSEALSANAALPILRNVDGIMTELMLALLSEPSMIVSAPSGIVSRPVQPMWLATANWLTVIDPEPETANSSSSTHGYVPPTAVTGSPCQTSPGVLKPVAISVMYNFADAAILANGPTPTEVGALP